MRKVVISLGQRISAALMFVLVVTLSVVALGASEVQASQGAPMYSWGLNSTGQLGHGDTASRYSPTRIGTADDWISVSTAFGGAAAVNAAGELYLWGARYDAPLMGRGVPVGSDATLITEPLRLDTPGSTWVMVDLKGHSIAAINNQGYLYTWGTNIAGGLGHGDSANRNVPTRVNGVSNWSTVSLGSSGWPAGTVSAGITVDGHLYTWGVTTNGALGRVTDAANPSNVPGRVGEDRSWRTVDVGYRAAWAISDDGELFTWGEGTGSGLGTGTAAHQLAPIQIGTASNWVSIQVISDARVVFALNSDGELYSWGRATGNTANTPNDRNFGRPITGSDGAYPRHIPVRIDDRNDWHALGGGNAHLLALTTGFELYALGRGDNGRLGTGDTNHRERLTRVLQTYGFAGFSVTGAGNHSMALIRTTPIPVPLTKILQMPQGTDIPGTPTFDIYFTPHQIPGATSVPGPSIPAASGIPANTVRIGLSPVTSTTTAGTTTVTGDIDLWNTLNNLTFPHAGVFVWNVHEIANSSSVNAGSTGHVMTYDANRFQIQAEVDVTNNIRAIHIFPMVYSAGVWTAVTADKQDYMEFINTLTYTPTTGSPANLAVTKQVTGDRANLTQLFAFTLTLTPHTLAPLPDSVTTRIVGPGNTVINRQVTRTGNVFTFSLYYNERLEVFYLPAGTTFAVTENAAQSFQPSVRTYSGGTLIHSETGLTNTALTANHADQRIHESGRNAADFINAHQHVPIVGLNIAGISILVIGTLIAFGALALIASSKRRSIEHLAMQ